MRVMQDYNLATAIAIRIFTQPSTCEIGASSFSAMSRIIFVSTTRASFPIMLSTERINRGKCFHF